MNSGGEPEATAEIGEKFALLVGVKGYNNGIRPLRYTENDIRALYEVLVDPERGGFPPDNVIVLSDSRDRKPTLIEINKALNELASAAGKDDTVLVYFSGHGETDGELSYLLTPDTDPGALQFSALPVPMFNKMIARIPARKKVIILDACHAGGVSMQSKGSGALTAEMYEDLHTRSSGEIRLLSCGESELSYETEELGGGRGVFSYFLVEALSEPVADRDGNGLVTITEIEDYVKLKVSRWSGKQGWRQTPTSEKKVEGMIVLSRVERPAEKAPEPSHTTGPNTKLTSAAISMSSRQRNAEGAKPYSIEDFVDTVWVDSENTQLVKELLQHASHLSMARQGEQPDWLLKPLQISSERVFVVLSGEGKVLAELPLRGKDGLKGLIEELNASVRMAKVLTLDSRQPESSNPIAFDFQVLEDGEISRPNADGVYIMKAGSELSVQIEADLKAPTDFSLLFGNKGVTVTNGGEGKRYSIVPLKQAKLTPSEPNLSLPVGTGESGDRVSLMIVASAEPFHMNTGGIRPRAGESNSLTALYSAAMEGKFASRSTHGLKPKSPWKSKGFIVEFR